MIDRTTVIGLLATAGLLAWVMVAGAGYAVGVFWRTGSLALVIGGAVFTTVMAFPGTRLRSIGAVLKSALYVRTRPPGASIVTLVALAEIARREGLLALERPVEGLSDGFVKRAMRMVIDGYDPSVVRSVMQAELESIDLRHHQNKGLLESMGRSAPVFGMIGTLIGLVIMLGGMDNPAKIGPGMAVALLTTLYGLVLANAVCLPLARKLSHRSSEELLGKTIALEGVLAIQAGNHPRIVAQKLQAYLPADQWAGEVVPSMSDRPASGGGEEDEEAEKAAVEYPSGRREAGRDLEEAA